MRCRECAAEVAVTARMCPECGAPIGQPPVVADTAVADTVVGAVSDGAGEAAAAEVAEQAPPEPYVPGSGAKLPAELRLVLAGYAGIAGGLFTVAFLAWATALALLFGDDDFDRYTDVVFDQLAELLGVSLDNGLYWLYWVLFILAFAAFFVGVVVLGAVGLEEGVDALQARIRFSRRLRRPSDPRTATVMASKRGGRTLILNIIPRDGTGREYQRLSEVRLALWTKAGMLVPGERVTVYGRPGGENPLLISSPQRGRAFLGT